MTTTTTARATKLAALGGTPAVPREERRIVTVIFVDLVGFTGRAEMLDPEDVRAVLAPYHDAVRTEIESFATGGLTPHDVVRDGVRWRAEFRRAAATS